MALSVVMPALEMAQETGRLLAWKKNEGDRVTKGEPLLEIETDKAVVEIESPGDGILSAVSAGEGAVVPVGQIIAWLVAPGEAAPSGVIARTGRQAAAAVPPTAAASVAPVASAPAEIRTSPKARRLAKERGVSLAAIQGSGPGGEILASDIPETADLPAETGTRNAGARNLPSGTNLQSEISNLKSRYSRLMGERTVKSWTTVPHFFLTRDISAAALIAAHETLAGSSMTDLFIALVARALTKHPQMNASWVDGVRPNQDVHVAIAIAVTDAVVTGVVHHAAKLSIPDIAARRKELTDRARAGRLQPDDISGATFTISNLGMYDIDSFTAIIVPPQAGILAVGAVADRVVAVDGRAVVRPMVTLTLSCDHRVVDGARAAAFLNDLAGAVRHPDAWLEYRTPSESVSE